MPYFKGYPLVDFAVSSDVRLEAILVKMGTLSGLPSLHNHRLSNNPSKLPSYRGTDLFPGPLIAPPHPPAVRTEHELALALEPAQHNATTPLGKHAHARQVSNSMQHQHTRNHSESATTTTTNSPSRSSLPLLARPLTFPGCATPELDYPAPASSSQAATIPAPPPVAKPRKGVPASHSSRNGLRDSWKGPPPAMLTQRHSDNTSDWVAEQSSIPPPISIPTTTTNVEDSPTGSAQSKTPITPLIPPIRAFRSSRRSNEMNAMSPRRPSADRDSRDETLRALEGFDRVNSHGPSNQEQEELNSDDSDLFLKLAREEASINNSSNRGLIRRSQIGRQSLPANSALFQPAISRRRGPEQDNASGSRPVDESGTMAQALTYRQSARDRVAPLDDVNRSRFSGGAGSRSNPITPRTRGSREISPESQVSYNTGRRPSVPDTVLPSRTSSYRQSNLSYSAPRIYNSSPLVTQAPDVHDVSEAPRGTEGTESTVSTTAPSTVWDELDDLKSRIHRLELTGKLPATSGAAMSRALNERPRTATTTVTTMSSSPKRGRGNSISPTDSVELPPVDAHPLLYSALAKSKSLLSSEVYKTLETTASDALAIAAMMGTSGQPGPISSSQSTAGGGPGLVSDRQVRRKADSLCRSLTELCLALSEGRNEQAQPTSNQNVVQTMSHDDQTINNLESNYISRPPLSTDLARLKSSPRALSRLEARRSSLLATSSLPSPRYAPSEASTPTQSSVAGRRTSLLLRSRRAGTEELEEEEEKKFRAPSRATTEIGRPRNSPREYISQQPLPDNRPSGIQPPRRHYVSTSLTSTGVPPVPALPDLGNRRYLDRSTPERDTTGLGRIDAQRKSSIGQGFPLGRTGSLTRRTRLQNGDSPGVSHLGGYQ